MASKEFNEISKVLKVLDQTFDLRVQFIQSIKDVIKKNDIDTQDAEMLLIVIAKMDDKQIMNLSKYAEEVDFVFPDV